LPRHFGGRIGDNEMFYFFTEWLREIIWQGVRFIKGGEKLNYFTTNDLDMDRKLKPGYLKDRAKRKKEREESGEDGFF